MAVFTYEKLILMHNALEVEKRIRSLLIDCSTEDYGRYTFKEMNPLSSLISLAANIRKPINFTTFLVFSDGTAKIIFF